MVTKFVWMIERPGIELCIGTVGIKLIDVLFTDKRALKFDTKEEAEQFKKEHSLLNYEIREHGFTDGPSIY